ncbi:hypothetical protein F4809DRAFT_587368 [Biscogniauxia mediterranea]|nr:hypothetical protein F4809DRAFT_587368 [Biscogniauxia mediterranea]
MIILSLSFSFFLSPNFPRLFSLSLPMQMRIKLPTYCFVTSDFRGKEKKNLNSCYAANARRPVPSNAIGTTH